LVLLPEQKLHLKVLLEILQVNQANQVKQLLVQPAKQFNLKLMLVRMQQRRDKFKFQVVNWMKVLLL